MTGPSESPDVASLLAVHDVERRAHLEGDARLMGSLFADEIIEASGGQVRRLTRAALQARFEQSWATLRYREWSDVEPPVVAVSGDLGWMLVRVHARRERIDGTALPDFDAAWISTFERRDGAWKLVAVSSSLVEAVEGAPG